MSWQGVLGIVPFGGSWGTVPELLFASAIKEEIMEKIEPLWDIKGVVVEFTE